MEQIYGLLILIGPAILAWQGYSWLRMGIWTALPIFKTFNNFSGRYLQRTGLGFRK